MERLPLDDLPKHAEWAAYLLDPGRNPPGELDAYTGTDTYEEIHSNLLSGYRKHPVPKEEVPRRIRWGGRSGPGVLSIDETLYLAEGTELVDHEYRVVQEALEPALSGNETVFDLGCGWGWTLDAIATAFPDARVVGGEYTPSGVEFSRDVFGDGDRVTVKEFDFYGDWDLLDEVDGERVVFTKGALVTLTDASQIVDRLDALAAEGTLSSGVHLEQVGPHPETTLGHLRCRYTEERGYNSDALEQMRSAESLAVTDVTYDVLGANPLHPLTRIRWRAE